MREYSNNLHDMVLFNLSLWNNNWPCDWCFLRIQIFFILHYFNIGFLFIKVFLICGSENITGWQKHPIWYLVVTWLQSPKYSFKSDYDWKIKVVC